MSFPSTFAILRGALIDATGPAGIHGYEKPEYLVIMNAIEDITNPSRPFYRITRSNGGNVDLDMNWPAKVGVSSCRISWGNDCETRQPIKTKYCFLPIYVTYFQSNGGVASCPVLSFERTFWMDCADKRMAHLSYREVNTEVVPKSLLWQSWTRSKMPLPAALKAVKDAFNGRCSKQEAVCRINTAYNDFSNGLDGTTVVLETPMTIINRVRTQNLPDVALRRMKMDLPIVRDFLGSHSNLVSTQWFIAECTRLGLTDLAYSIRKLVFTHDNMTNISKNIINKYACNIIGYPSDTFDNHFISFELHLVREMFQNCCLAYVNDTLPEILHAYRTNIQHQQSQDENQRSRAEAAFNEALEYEDAARYGYQQEEDERIEDYIEENRQEMAEYNEAQMEAEQVDMVHTNTDNIELAREDLLQRVSDAAHNARQALLTYAKLRKEAKAPLDVTVPRLRGIWFKRPTVDGRDLEETEADEMATIAEVREGTDGCPWPYFVYSNHAKVELDKGTECPITMVPLSSCKRVSVSMSCGHIYESKAITAWTNVTGAHDAKCPTCRTPIAGMWQIRTKTRSGDTSGSDSA